MGTEIAKGIVTLESDGDDLTKSVKQTLNGIQKEAEKAAGETSKSLSGFVKNNQKDFVDFGKKGLLATGILTAGLVATATAASDLGSAISANEQVLGDASKKVQTWSKDSVEAVGLSKRAAIDASTGFGQLAKIAGETGDGVADFSTEMVELAADMAAFKNVGTDQALADLQSGFAGSTEVLRKYNIFLDDAGLKQAYMSATGETVTGTLTAQQRVLATHFAVLEQSKDMQGQWARESDSLQAQQSKLKAEVENMAASVGQVLVPTLSSLVGYVADGVGWFGQLNDATGGLAGKLLGFTAVGLGAVSAVSLIVGKVSQMTDRLKPAFDAVSRLAGGYGNLTKVMGGIALGVGAYLALNSLVVSGEEEKKSQTDKYTAALKAQAAGQRDAISAQITADIGNKEFLDTMHKLGLTEPDIAALITSGKSLFDVGQQLTPAWENAAAAIGNVRGDVLAPKFDAASASTKAWAESLGLGRGEADNFVTVVNDAAIAMGTAQSAFTIQTEVSKNLEGATDDLTKSTDLNAQALNGVATASTNAKPPIDNLNRAAILLAGAFDTGTSSYQAMRDELNNEGSLDSAQDNLAQLQADLMLAWHAGETGAEDAAEKAEAYTDQLRTTKQSVIDVGEQFGLLPTQIDTLLTLTDNGQIGLVEQMLTNLTRNRTISLDIIAKGGVGYDALVGGKRASGGPVTKNVPYITSELGPELFVPESNGYIYNARDTERMMGAMMPSGEDWAGHTAQPSGPLELTLIIEGEPISARIADHDRDLAQELLAGRR